MKKCNKKISAGIPGMADGGRPTPHHLGMGMARTAGGEMGRRGRVVDSTVDGAVNPAPAARTAPAGKGGMSGIRNNATPPAAMLQAQRRGMADGGMMRGNADELESGNGGMVRGPGGPTDDRVGPVALSPKEYVLPPDTVEAMGGREVLDAIRAKTHKFVDPKNKPAIMRGMANGGYVVNELPVEEISMGRSRADRATIDSAVRKGQRPPGMAKNPTVTPALDRVSAQMQQRARPAAPAPKTGMIGKGIGALAAADAIASSAAPDSTARYAQRFGVSEPTGDGSVGDMAKFGALRIGGFASDLGNSLTLGAAGNLYADKPDGLLQFSQPAKPVQPANQPAAGQRQSAGNPAAGQAPAQESIGTSVPSVPSIGKVNVSRQSNGVMSFSGSGDISGGYEGPAAGQLKGGGSMGAVTPADQQAALARAAADKERLNSLVRSRIAAGTADDTAAAYELASGSPEAMAALEESRNQRTMRNAALNGNREAAAMYGSDQNNATERLKIAQMGQESGLDKAKTRGQEIENEQAAAMSKLVSDYLSSPDERVRADALAKLQALNPKGKDGSDKYILVDVDTGQVDAMGTPVMAKMPFNTRTGQVVNPNGGGAPAQQQQGYPEGTELTGPDGRAYVVQNGQPVLIQ